MFFIQLTVAHSDKWYAFQYQETSFHHTDNTVLPKLYVYAAHWLRTPGLINIYIYISRTFMKLTDATP
jgi:hypothetical protein